MVDHGYEKYLTTKRSRRPGTDPIQDLRDGWDTHTDFALRNPNLYRLMNSPAMRTPPPPPWSPIASSPRTSGARPNRAAAPGPRTSRPDDHVRQRRRLPDAGLPSDDLHGRDALPPDTGRGARGRLHPEAMGPETTSAGDEETGAEDEEAGAEEVLPATATHLAALLRRTPRPDFTPGESALLGEWLDRLSNTTPE